MATDKPIKQPLRRTDPSYYRQSLWGGALRTPSSGNASKDVYRHLPSKFDAAPAQRLAERKGEVMNATAPSKFIRRF